MPFASFDPHESFFSLSSKLQNSISKLFYAGKAQRTSLKLFAEYTNSAEASENDKIHR